MEEFKSMPDKFQKPHSGGGEGGSQKTFAEQWRDMNVNERAQWLMKNNVKVPSQFIDKVYRGAMAPDVFASVPESSSSQTQPEVVDHSVSSVSDETSTDEPGTGTTEQASEAAASKPVSKKENILNKSNARGNVVRTGSFRAQPPRRSSYSGLKPIMKPNETGNKRFKDTTPEKIKKAGGKLPPSLAPKNPDGK